MTEYQNSQLNTGASIDEYTRSSIAATAKIAGITAMLTITGAVIGGVAHFLKSDKAGAAKEGFGSTPSFNFDGSSVFTVIISLAINGLMFYYLHKFSSLTRQALRERDDFLLADGMVNLASYFRVAAFLFIMSVGFLGMALLMVGLGNAM